MKMKLISAALGLTAVSVMQAVSADVICSTKAGALSLRSSCKKTESVVNPAVFGGAQGPAGPAGAQGPIGPAGAQGAAGIGVTNAPCALADFSGNPWSLSFFDALSNESDICLVAFNAQGNFLPGGQCNQSIGLVTTDVPVVSGSVVLNSAPGCGYGIKITKANGGTWVGYTTMDRTRSTVQGIAGIALNSTLVRSNTIMTGTRYGSVVTSQSLTPALVEQTHESIRKALSGE